jgi:hypothetical protein
MATPNEFWLALHHLAEAYEAEGMTPDERAENIGGELRKLPPLVRRTLIGDIRRLAVNLFDLYPLMSSQETYAEENRGTGTGGAA